jgi:ATP adenylyltransferase
MRWRGPSVYIAYQNSDQQTNGLYSRGAKRPRNGVQMGSGCDRHPLDLLWAPWRMKYIVTSDRPSECVFCAKGCSDSDRENHVLCRYETCFALLNRYPYNNGHILVAPYQHVSDLEGLGDDQLLGIMKLLRECKSALAAAMSPDGFNVGLNLGSAAGAGIEGHLHFHIVPRWRGDTNFMTVTGRTKVIPQSLDEAYAALRDALSGQKG